MEKKVKPVNAVQWMHQNTPQVVWDHYQNLMVAAIWDLEIDNYEKNNLKQTFLRQRNGVRTQRSLLSMNIFLRECYEKTFPIVSQDFWKPHFKKTIAAAEASAQQMIEDFERILETQKNIVQSRLGQGPDSVLEPDNWKDSPHK